MKDKSSYDLNFKPIHSIYWKIGKNPNMMEKREILPKIHKQSVRNLPYKINLLDILI